MVEYEEGTLKLFSKPCNINLKTNNQILFNSPFSLYHNTNSHSIIGSAPYLIFSEDSTCISSDLHSMQSLLLKFEGQLAQIRQFPQDAPQQDPNPDGHIHLQQETANRDLSDSRSSEWTDAVLGNPKELLVRLTQPSGFPLMPKTDASRLCVPVTHSRHPQVHTPLLPLHFVSEPTLGFPAPQNPTGIKLQLVPKREDDPADTTQQEHDRDGRNMLRRCTQRSDLPTGPGKESDDGNPKCIPDRWRKRNRCDKGMSRF